MSHLIPRGLNLQRRKAVLFLTKNGFYKPLGRSGLIMVLLVNKDCITARYFLTLSGGRPWQTKL